VLPAREIPAYVLHSPPGSTMPGAPPADIASHPRLETMKKLFSILIREIREIIPPTLFFFAAFNFILLTTSLMLDGYQANLWSVTKAAVGALIVGKVVLLADKLPIVNLFPHKPLIYNIFWKTLLYQAGAILFRIVEEVIGLQDKAGGFVAAIRVLLDEVVWDHFIAVQLWLFVLFLFYCTVREFTRVVGSDRLIRLFFRKPPTAETDKASDPLA